MLTVITFICLLIILLRFITIFNNPSIICTKRKRVLLTLIIPISIIYLTTGFIFATYILILTVNMLIGFFIIMRVNKNG